MGDRTRYSIGPKFMQQEQYETLQSNFNEEYNKIDKEIESEYLNRRKSDFSHLTQENNQKAKLMKKLNELVFSNSQKQKQINSLIKEISSIKGKSRNTLQASARINTEKSCQTLFDEIESLYKKLKDCEINELLEQETTDQLDYMWKRTKDQHILAKGKIDEISSTYSRLTKNIEDIRSISHKSGTSLLIAQYEALKMNKVYNKSKEIRSQKIESKQDIFDNINKKIKQSKKDITIKKLKNVEYGQKKKVLFSRLENSLESYNQNQASFRQYKESAEQVKVFLQKISEIVGKDINQERFGPNEAEQIIKEYQLIAYKNESLERYYMNLVDSQEDHKKRYEDLIAELSEFGLGGALSIEINSIKEKSSSLFEKNHFKTYNQLLSAIEEKPTPFQHSLSTSYENFSIYALLYLIQIVQRLIKQVEYIENEANCSTLKGLIENIKERFNELKKDTSIKKNEKSSSMFEKPLEFSLYLPPTSKNSFTELLQEAGELSVILSENEDENAIIKYFTNPKEVKDFLSNLEDRSALNILNNLPKLICVGHQNLQTRSQTSISILKAILIAMGKYTQELNFQLETNFEGKSNTEALKKASADMEELFSITETTENIKTTDPVVKSILEHKKRQIRRLTKKNTFALKDDFEQFVTRFEIMEPLSSKVEQDQRSKIFEEINELFSEIPERKGEEEEKELDEISDETPKQMKISRTHANLKARTKIDSPTFASLPLLYSMSNRSTTFSKKEKEKRNKLVLQEIRHLENRLRKVKEFEQNSEKNEAEQLMSAELYLRLPNIKKQSSSHVKKNSNETVISKSIASIISGDSIV
ncbi:unnamed protein product [Blepharisma stoltei]|uniref:Uncharacterized protein n=1 Tax=Blepharisma stoltei TaxID=1481888 RepID=A0AAU9IGQ8_9CILI|nr:unnamed protein product [Blepharisma stoltei]